MMEIYMLLPRHEECQTTNETVPAQICAVGVEKMIEHCPKLKGV